MKNFTYFWWKFGLYFLRQSVDPWRGCVAGWIFYVLSPCIVSALAQCMVVSGCCRVRLWSFVLVSTCSFVLGLMSPRPSLLLLVVTVSCWLIMIWKSEKECTPEELWPADEMVWKFVWKKMCDRPTLQLQPPNHQNPLHAQECGAKEHPAWNCKNGLAWT